MQNLRVCLVAMPYLLALVSFSPAQAATEEIVISTYYPSPYGVYQYIKIFPTDVCPSAPDDCRAANKGLLFYSGTYSGSCSSSAIETDKMYYCNGTEWISMGEPENDDTIQLGTFSKSGGFNLNGTDWQNVYPWTPTWPSPLPCTTYPSSIVNDSNGNPSIFQMDISCFGAGIYSVAWGGIIEVDGADTKSMKVRVLYRFQDTSGNWGSFYEGDRSDLYNGDGGGPDTAYVSYTIPTRTFSIYRPRRRRIQVKVEVYKNAGNATIMGRVLAGFSVEVMRGAI